MKKPIARLIALLAVCAVCAGAFSACDPSGMRRDELYRITYAEDGSPIVTFNPDYVYEHVDLPEDDEWDSASGLPYIPVEMTFEHFMRDLVPDTDKDRAWDSIYIVRIIKRISRAEADERFAGLEEYSNDLNYAFFSYYEAEIIYDYLRDKPVGKKMIFAYMVSEKTWYHKGMTPLIAGDTVVALLSTPKLGNELVCHHPFYVFYCYDMTVSFESYIYACDRLTKECTIDISERVPEDMLRYDLPGGRYVRSHGTRVPLRTVLEQFVNGVEEAGYDFPKD